ncbi:uridine diphosphate-N-acetylglucosamine-binding protein YvcK [Corynebacterium propinquum]|jgi:hypothetical protein|uniref:Putative gluconeogenesis factor n=1 Tax=Corynebacterium propinquum TaxID=43769 RepID=A0AAP4BS58_9CORY|nr:uridine diphosphate-N-acetylglucosamine-binding protein YvcK [Corynebacterium propinquum]MCT1817864.1 uridine diphosphate-N-acetylglucosamine-binding protein YvcK [Corynebacterium propinquum]MDK4250821.1 uridine diphosphate-N-acetylglucosamine-binding protein YvcK [Corynebacterium propinquum]MDK4291278.1 uridine diphosphate-N-acetylglucosamine-binding protein YvcK [Corynebacterium propinquum]MDK4302455.1 uridine diphosphate-N-acetylglucosamine-binding protein YvcK [Corynebacterium propinquum
MVSTPPPVPETPANEQFHSDRQLPERIASLGGGHGLFQTLKAARRLGAEHISAIVTVADDGGSSGRLRKEFDMIPPGDLRMALVALSVSDSEEAKFWEQTLQHRFGGSGALAGHALGNLLITALKEILGQEQAALDAVTRLTGAQGRVLPVCTEPLDIQADVSGLDEDPRVMRSVRGQVAVASTPGQVRRVSVIPSNPQINPAALKAIADAELVTIGPGSWFSSVIPHLVLPEIVRAINECSGLRVLVLNLNGEPGETQGFSYERHIHVLAQHAPGLHVDVVICDSASVTSEAEREYLRKAARILQAEMVFADVREIDEAGRESSRHEEAKLADTLREVYAKFLVNRAT